MSSFLLFVFTIGLALSLAVRKSLPPDARSRGVAASWMFGIGIVFALLLGGVRMIPPGSAGVQVLFGKVLGLPLREGFHVVNPLVNIEVIDIRTQQYTMVSRDTEGNVRGDDSVPIFSKDTLRLNADVTVIYRVDPNTTPWMFRNFGAEKDYVDKIVRPAARSAFRVAALRYNMLEILGDKRTMMEQDLRTLLESSVANIINTSLDSPGGKPVLIQDVLIRNIEPPDSLKKSVEQKLVAEQDAERMQYVLQKERQEAERKKIEAQGIADFQRVVRMGLDEMMLKWKGIEATTELAKSQNTKIVVIGGKDGMPLILNGTP